MKELFSSSGLFTAVVRASGEAITVYLLKSGLWCNYSDCTTTYKTEELDQLIAK